MTKLIILTLIMTMGQKSWAQIREFQTTRLNSTSGAGVASALSTEAAILNPASSAFFAGTNFSYQSYSTTLQHESDQRALSNDDFPGRNRSQGYFIADQDGPLKGGFAYLTQDENHFQRKQMIIHSAAPIDDKTAVGLSYHYIQDKLPHFSSSHQSIGHQVTAGITRVLDESTMIGLVINDPTRSRPDEERATGGIQYAFASRFTLMADIGTQYTKDVRKKHVWKSALQMQLFDDFFFRAGTFNDNIRGQKGTSWGVSWIGPKLGVEFAQKFTTQFTKHDYLYKDESLVDTSLSAVLKF
jgi:hypothetical protein